MITIGAVGSALSCAWSWARNNTRLVLAMLGAVVGGAVAIWTYRQGVKNKALEYITATAKTQQKIIEADHEYEKHSAEIDRTTPDLHDNILRRAREINAASEPGPDK